ncbi:MAG: NUDIX domain-containing protein [Candidatus Micrarchaeales archaeon]|jgi:isopentenyl-diphosphate delta-isomerase type 1
MELLYKINENDEVLGSVERDKAHADCILHRSGVIFLANGKGEILVQWRSERKKTFPGCYECSVSFHVTFGESYEEAARRELKEEIGVSAPIHYVGKFTYLAPPENEMVAVFISHSDDEVELDKEEMDSARFYPRKEVEKIAKSEKAAPWFRSAWEIAKDKL